MNGDTRCIARSSLEAQEVGTDRAQSPLRPRPRGARSGGSSAWRDSFCLMFWTRIGRERGVQLSYSFELQFCYNSLQNGAGSGVAEMGSSNPPS